MAYGDRCLMVHGHFYQPPRENPWTGRIEPQHSADPWENWNCRIADECYLPMTRSPVRDNRGLIVDLYNNYAHTSFDFGPTLLSWFEDAHPRFIKHLADAAVFDRSFAVAQAYNHMMLPLADARDRHTQILWGLREFRHRFGFYPDGMWLPECGIDPNTVRALIDHRVKFVILSPHQASKARPFGQAEWNDAAMGAVDTRRAYRMFEIDGGGRTHFDRWLDVVFYTPGLNLKVSFDHILNRPDDLARELESCYRSGYGDAQLVSIVTDGEIYGHHEKHGEEALSRLFRDIAPSLGLKVVSAGEFVRDNPPTWEIKLWNGPDGYGSSWSCEHGMGRWLRDCGCRPPTPPGWTQKWRGPLREAFDRIRSRVRSVARRELGGLVRDADDARNDYISVILDPSPASRGDFIRRHAQRPLAPGETEKLWRMLEALHNAMLMYTSCGWFFDEISGIEPVQNMRYALRAARLVQPYHDEDLADLLERDLSKAKSNIPSLGDGGRVFREQVLPSRHSNRELAAAMAVCLAAGFPVDCLSWRLVERTETMRYSDSEGNSLSWGSFVCLDERLDRFIKTGWVVRMGDFDSTGVGLYGYEEAQGDPDRADGRAPFAPDADFSWLRAMERETRRMTRQDLEDRFGEYGVWHNRLPEAVRGMLYRKFAGDKEEELLADFARLGAKAAPFLSRAWRHGARVPDAVVKAVTGAFEQEMAQSVHAAIAAMSFDEAVSEGVERSRSSAAELGLHPGLDVPWRAVFAAGMELLHWLSCVPERGWLGKLRPLRLPDGGEWLAPRCRANHHLRYPEASGLSLALGRGLAGLLSRLVADVGWETRALEVFPLVELLEFADRVGLEPRGAAPLGAAFWDFTDKPLTRLMRPDSAGLLTGDFGNRVRRLGVLLGFESRAVERRILAAMSVSE